MHTLDSLIEIAKDAGIKVPIEPNDGKFNRYNYSQWCVYNILHNGYNISDEQKINNARIIAKIPDSDIVGITVRKLKKLGCNFILKGD